MAVFYALTFGGTGVSLPFITPWLTAHGLSGAEAGVILGAPMLGRIVTSPLAALWADGFRLRRTPILILASAVVAAYVGLQLTRGFGPWLCLWFVGASALGAIIPLADVLSLRRARREGFVFAWPRGVGSLAFIGANVAMGALLTRLSIDIVMVWMVAAAAGMGLAAAFVLPEEPVSDAAPSSRSARFAGLGRLLRDRAFMGAIVSVGLIQSTHAFYYGFSAVTWRAQGLSESLTGLLWGTGVGAEVAFLWFMEPLRRRLGPLRLLGISGAAAVVRWTAFAFSPPLWLIWPLQLLHGLTFAASYLAGLELVERLTPPESHSAGQTLSSALSAGVLIGLATMLSGGLYDRFGAYGYLAMSGLALAGLAGLFRLRPALAAPARA
jgi:PPP family 3-phenylpropionic acid transporter